MAICCLINFVCMVFDSVWLFMIKFAKYNRSMAYNTGEVPLYMYVGAVALLLITIGVNIAEVVILKKKQKLSVFYLIVSMIMLIVPYVVYTRA